MKRYKSYFKESLNFKNADEFISWVSSLSIPKRKPQNISSIEHNALLGMSKIINDPEYKYNIDFRNTLIMNKLPQLRLDKEEYESAYSNNANQPNIIKTNYATYKHNDAGSYQRFVDNVKDIEEFLSTLKGYHKLALKNLKIEFVSSSDMKTPAKFISNKKI